MKAILRYESSKSEHSIKVISGIFAIKHSLIFSFRLLHQKRSVSGIINSEFSPNHKNEKTLENFVINVSYFPFRQNTETQMWVHQ